MPNPIDKLREELREKYPTLWQGVSWASAESELIALLAAHVEQDRARLRELVRSWNHDGRHDVIEDKHGTVDPAFAHGYREAAREHIRELEEVIGNGQGNDL